MVACLPGQHRSTLRYQPRAREDEVRLVADKIALSRQYGSYGYRSVAVLLRDVGWQVIVDRLEHLDTGGMRVSRVPVALEPNRPVVSSS